MSFEEELRRSMSERAGAVRTEPDSADLAARIGRAELRSQRVQRSAQVFALVLVTGSVGGFVGAYAHRSTPAVAASSKAPGPRSASETTLPSGLTSNSWTPLTSETDGADQPSVTFSFAATVHDQHANGFSVEWALSSNTSPLAVTLGPSGIACLPTRAVTLLVSSKGTPLASGTGVVGVPPLDRNGLAVVSAGSFGSPGLPGGWWAVVEAGSASKTIVAQFPNGQVDTSRVSSTGLAVVAGLDNGQIPEGPQDVTFTSE
ncbi:MAG TPA: hypothetical protein VGS21_02640, partial [Acidimicrobiales bacterium]|nr:hypothetical protein [Acidimicrobiales bacterium]